MEARSYVDDLNRGSLSVEGLKQPKIDVRNAMAEGGFPLAKWKSNVKEVGEADANAAVKKIGVDDNENMTKILGISWETQSDTLNFVFDEEITKNIASTPRELVAIQASLFDPLGFVSPFQLLEECYNGR